MSADSQIPADAQEKTLKDLEASLFQNQSMDASDRETVLRHFADALKSQVSGIGAQGPDRSQWLQTLDLLKNEKLLSPGQCDELTQEFDKQMRAVHSDEVMRALELAKVSREGGAEAAREWLNKRRAAQG